MQESYSPLVSISEVLYYQKKRITRVNIEICSNITHLGFSPKKGVG